MHSWIVLRCTYQIVQAAAVLALSVCTAAACVKWGLSAANGHRGTSSCCLNNMLQQQLHGLCIHTHTSQALIPHQLFERQQQQRGQAVSVTTKLSHSTATAAAHNPALIRRDTGTYATGIQILIASHSCKLLCSFERKPHSLIQRPQGRPNCHGAKVHSCAQAVPHLTSWLRNSIFLHWSAQDSGCGLPPDLLLPN